MKSIRWAAVMMIMAVSGAVTTRAQSSAPAAVESRWGANYFPNVPLTTQDGEKVRFYDLIKGKIVAIDLIYTTCEYNCPLETARLAEVQRLLGDRMGRDVFFYSISIDPKHDTPAVLKSYAAQYGAGPGWLFLAGKQKDVDLLSKKLGLYSAPNPDNKDGHTPTLLIGNEATGQWMQGSALDNPQYTAKLIGDWVGGWKAAGPLRSYAEVRAMRVPDKGEYLFATKCVSCHTIGRGAKVGPDLAGVTAARDPGWLARYVYEPDVVLKEGDPIAKVLSGQYPGTRMPNLDLTEDEVTAVIAYITQQSTKVASPAKPMR